MALGTQVINPGPSVGGSLGSSLGQGLAGGLTNLANMKLQQIQQQRNVEQGASLWKNLGLPDQVAYGLAQSDPTVQRSFLDRLIGLQLPPSNQQMSLQPQIQSPENQQLLEKLGISTQQLTGQQPQQIQQVVRPNAAQTSGLSLGPNSAERRHQETLRQQKELAEKKEASKEKIEAYKLTQKERKEILDKAKASRNQLQDLERLEELEKEGKLDTPGYVEFLKRSGLDIPALMNEGSEEYNKIVNNFTRDIKSYFGSRISNLEIEQFLKTLPSLSQSPSGRNRIISNLKKIARTSLEYNNALKEVLSENKGIPPLDLSEKVDAKVEKKLDKISEQFKKDLAKPVPPGQNKYITSFQAGLGNASSLVKPIAGAAIGGALGGPVGAAVGGLGGTAANIISKLLG